ncbi:succinate-semialdehyde dehydrogenase/glutarate-semialdehyde dehydrogenase [Mumia flava]|uniref:Succinate-semialdehyde dehydrogenase/glutarate-semialdehyde dehydrogenase n=1 Tax=Mumia flava TaxID=1348852 RepID=A0A0B2BSS5_9ACTN|nr:succinic semialdehyde dehydrogenase [Mumia flava]PJJ58410.1 succinate-semialdehyde dehydrogenase/glutarate-semialdehyde dehydrogenase [Mumia flava]
MAAHDPRRSDVSALPADPEHDPTAAFALDPARVRTLTARLRATSGRSVTTEAPFTGQPVASIPLSDVADVEAGFEEARTVQRSWARTELDHRASLLLDLHDAVLDHADELMDLVQWEAGKARAHAFDEVLHVALTARYYGRTLRKHLGGKRVAGVYPMLTHARINRVPKGVVGIISPWNYPLTLAVSDGIPAIAAGNAVVHKPDSQTPLSALAAVELLDEVGFPSQLWQVVYGAGSVIGSAIIDRADYVCFTGSTATGKRVAAQAADRLVSASLELGGKNPMLVLADADVDRAVEGAIRGCFSSAGQLCVSVERLFVADAVYDRFVAKLVERVSRMRLAPTIGYGADMGSLVSQAQLDTVVRHVDDAVARGARVLTGGRARPDIGPYFYEPTLLEGVDPTMTCFAEETFGPVVSLYRFGGEAEAIERANDGEYGLNASIFTRDAKRGRALAGRIKAGTVNVNEGFAATFGSVEAPMGGMRESGVGRRHGAEGILRYTETQSVASQSLVPLAAPRFVGDATYEKTMIAALRVLKKLGRR